MLRQLCYRYDEFEIDNRTQFIVEDGISFCIENSFLKAMHAKRYDNKIYANEAT